MRPVQVVVPGLALHPEDVSHDRLELRLLEGQLRGVLPQNREDADVLEKCADLHFPCVWVFQVVMLRCSLASMLSGSPALGSQSFMLSCPHALVPSCSHALLLSCSQALLLSGSHALILSCSHALLLSGSQSFMLSCSRALRLSCSPALMLSCSHVLLLSCSHTVLLSCSFALMPSCSR